MQVEGICKLCGESAILQKSHLLPRALFPKVADEKGKVVVIHRDIGASYPPGMGHIKRNLLCQKCENLFSKFEKIVIHNCLSNNGDFKLRASLAKALGYMSAPEYSSRFIFPDACKETINSKIFFDFALSIFWRASICHWHNNYDSYYNAFGKYQDIIRDILLEQPHNINIFVIYAVNTGEKELSFLTLPVVKKYGGYHIHSFDIPGIRIYAYIGKQLPDWVTEFSIKKGNIVFLECDFMKLSPIIDMCKLIQTTPAFGKLKDIW